MGEVCLLALLSRNNARLQSDNIALGPCQLLNNPDEEGYQDAMRSLFASLLLALAISASPAAASCYADYKAKRDNPLRLHYGIIELDDAYCPDKSAARPEIARRIAVDNWKLLAVQSIFGADGLKEREASAGRFYLRF